VEITFYGVRGSTPCAGESTSRYGGNTASVVLRSADADPILLDLGTGLRYFGADQGAGVQLHAHALVTHLPRTSFLSTAVDTWFDTFGLRTRP
jgi:phosphoribosyl 1,2-cyclic phosphodiesterase